MRVLKINKTFLVCVQCVFSFFQKDEKEESDVMFFFIEICPPKRALSG